MPRKKVKKVEIRAMRRELKRGYQSIGHQLSCRHNRAPPRIQPGMEKPTDSNTEEQASVWR